MCIYEYVTFKLHDVIQKIEFSFTKIIVLRRKTVFLRLCHLLY